jgi:hypothetical protein
MKKLLFILGITLGLATSVNALEAGDRHADPFKVITKGKVIGQDIRSYDTGNTYTSFLVAYQGEIYSCYESRDRKTYSCIFLEPKIN